MTGGKRGDEPNAANVGGDPSVEWWKQTVVDGVEEGWSVVVCWIWARCVM